MKEWIDEDEGQEMTVIDMEDLAHHSGDKHSQKADKE